MNRYLEQASAHQHCRLDAHQVSRGSILYIVMDNSHVSGIYKALRLKWGTVSLGLQGFQGCWEKHQDTNYVRSCPGVQVWWQRIYGVVSKAESGSSGQRCNLL